MNKNSFAISFALVGVGVAMWLAVQCGTCSEITPSVGAIIGMDVLSLCNIRLSNDGASTVLHISLAAHT